MGHPWLIIVHILIGNLRDLYCTWLKSNQYRKVEGKLCMVLSQMSIIPQQYLGTRLLLKCNLIYCISIRIIYFVVIIVFGTSH